MEGNVGKGKQGKQEPVKGAHYIVRVTITSEKKAPGRRKL